ncbi:MAG TPA: hypothetical protein VF269_07295 [Rhodanobacteraceae bacterium]
MATGTTPQSTPATKNVLPVLVKVNKQGKVTEALPAHSLSTSLQGLLQKTLNKMITKPARDKHGKPIASQMIVNFNMISSKQANGSYAFEFAYVSAQPVPPGDWYWSHYDHGTRGMVLVSRGSQLGMAQRDQRQERDDNLTMQAVYEANHSSQSSSSSGNSGKSGGSSH